MNERRTRAPAERYNAHAPELTTSCLSQVFVMAAKKRTPLERERDLERAAALHCSGRSQRAIAEALHVSQQQICYDLRLLQKRWQESARALLDEHKARQLARIDHLERVAWEAWERSCQDAETTSAKRVQGRTTKEGEPLPDLCTSARVTKGQAGDPRFLERVAWCIEQRSKIIGLYAQPNGPQAAEDPSAHGSLTDEQRATGFARLLAIMEARKLGPYAQGNGQSPPSSPN